MNGNNDEDELVDALEALDGKESEGNAVIIEGLSVIEPVARVMYVHRGDVYEIDLLPISTGEKLNVPKYYTSKDTTTHDTCDGDVHDQVKRQLESLGLHPEWYFKKDVPMYFVGNIDYYEFYGKNKRKRTGDAVKEFMERNPPSIVQ